MTARLRRGALGAAGLLLAGALLMRLPWIQGAAPAPPLNANHQCSFCHQLHSAPGGVLKKETQTETLCLTCHGPAGSSTLKAAVHTNKTGSSYPAFTETCVDCHDPHDDRPNAEGGTNLKLVLDYIATPNSGARAVVFESRGTGAGEPSHHSFADNDEDGDGDWDGVCEVCHTLTAYHRNDASGDHSHNTGATCVQCHPHDANFVATGGGCTDCHNTAQDNGDGVPPGGRRAVVGEFSRSSHHLQGASIDNADCEVCHDQSQHQQGYVRLKNADDGTIYTLTGDPATSSTEAAKLTPFCLSCHDADAAGGSVPFTDGVTPPVIDATAWSNSSHNGAAAIAGCYGDGSFGCHGTGHGSEKRKLLAPADVAPTAPANAEEEEGFCLNCHDSDGPAGTDLKTRFDATINWVQLAAGLNDNSNLNDRHDVQYAAQSRSGAKIECTDCHDPHTATSALPYILDPDTGDAHDPGDPATYYYYASTADTLSEFCLDCHDGSFPSSVTDQTTAIVNIRSTWADDGMGARTGSSVDLRSGTGWAVGDVIPCWACHTAHVTLDQDIAGGTPTLFSVVDTVKNKAGTAYLPFEDRKGNQIWAYAITDNANKSDVTSGGYWCNTCHVRLSMTGKQNCYQCHRHGDGGRF